MHSIAQCSFPSSMGMLWAACLAGCSNRRHPPTHGPWVSKKAEFTHRNMHVTVTSTHVTVKTAGTV